MTQELYLTAFRTTSCGLVPVNVPFVPGIDEQLIAKEDEKMARMQRHLQAQGKCCPATAAEEAFMKKLALQEKAHDIIHNPEVCRCSTGKQHCHLNVHHVNAQVITRGRSDCCPGCC